MDVSTEFANHERPLWRTTEWFHGADMEFCHAYLHRIHGNSGVHANEFCELNIVMEGHARHQINGREYSAEFGSVYFLPGGVRHGYFSDSGAMVFHALIRYDFFQRYDQELRALPGYTMMFEVDPYLRSERRDFLPVRLTSNAYAPVAAMIQELIRHDRSQYAGRNVQKNACLLNLIGHLSAYAANMRPSQPDANANPNALAVARSMEFIRLNASRKISIDELARNACMARSTFTRNFAAVCGKTPMQFLLQCRMATARRLLCYSAKPITTVALECGFYDTSHFIHVFSHQEGCTPSDFRLLYSGTARFSVCSICTSGAHRANNCMEHLC